MAATLRPVGAAELGVMHIVVVVVANPDRLPERVLRLVSDSAVDPGRHQRAGPPAMGGKDANLTRHEGNLEVCPGGVIVHLR
jgi:hypothetical protein